MLPRLTPGRIFYLNAVARVITCRASALLPSGFSRTNLYWCRRISQRRISSWLASRRSRSRPPHAYKWGPCPCIGQWIRLQDLINPASLSPSREDPNDEHPEDALPAPSHVRWRRDALQPPQVQHGIGGRDTCGHFSDGGLRCITWNTRGLVGSVFSSQKKQGAQTQIFQEAPWQQQHHMSPGGARTGWVSPGYSGADSAI